MRIISYIVIFLVGFWKGITVSRKEALKKISEMYNDIQRKICLLHCTSDWLKMFQEGKNFHSYFRENKIRTAAVYGVGFLGERLIDELAKIDVNVLYAIDLHKKGKYAGIEIKNLDEQLLGVDVIIVTPIYDYHHIANILMEKTESAVISLEQIIYSDLYS